jgi:hypothetical protein
MAEPLTTPSQGGPPMTTSVSDTPLVYTLVGYRPNGTDSCRNCVMGRSDSDFFLNVHTDVERLADEWARRRFNEAQGASREICSYEYTLLINGLDESSEEFPLLESAWTHAHGLTKARLALLDSEFQAAQERKAADEARRRQCAQERAQVAKQAQEHAEYLRLRAKYEEPPR